MAASIKGCHCRQTFTGGFASGVIKGAKTSPCFYGKIISGIKGAFAMFDVGKSNINLGESELISDLVEGNSSLD